MSNAYAIIGIHGLARKPKQTTLDKWWTKSILEGLNRNQGRTSSTLAFQGVYWADVVHDKPIAKSNNKQPYTSAAGTGPMKTYNDGWRDEVRAQAGDLLARPLDWAKQHFGIDQIADAILRKKLQDLAQYYDAPAIRTELRQRLRDAILANKDKRMMVIAHSMGSIIAYDVLRALGRQDPSLSVDHFITIGSPLGLPHVKFKIQQENDQVRTPTIVKRWTNFADRRDPVAVDVHLASDYGSNDRRVHVKDDLIINGYRNPQGDPNYHKSYGYLRTPEISHTIRSFI